MKMPAMGIFEERNAFALTRDYHTREILEGRATLPLGLKRRL